MHGFVFVVRNVPSTYIARKKGKKFRDLIEFISFLFPLFELFREKLLMLSYDPRRLVHARF